MANTFKNPVITGFNPDPSIVRVGADYFLTTSTFEYFPGLPIYHSDDLLNWKNIGHVLTRRSQLDMRTVEPGAGIWAPTLRWRKDQGGENGRFYVATCTWNRYRPQIDERIFPRGFYVYTDNIWNENAWSEPIYFDNAGFDQDLFWDDDGKVYLSTTMRMATRPLNSTQKDFAIHISQIDINTGRTLTAPEIIRASPHGIAEGSHILKRGPLYYLFTAEGGTEAGHHEVVLRSNASPLGPWELGPKLWYNGTDDEVQNTGHADIFEDAKGEWWAVFLGMRPQRINGEWKDSQLGRETYLVKVDWEDDWPVFNYGKNVSLLTLGKDGSTALKASAIWNANFATPQLELGWYMKNTPLKQFYEIDCVENIIRIYGSHYDLQSPESPSMLLRKQTAFDQSFITTLDFQEKHIGSEAGIVVWYSMYTFASLGLRRCASGHGWEMVQRVPSSTAACFQTTSALLERVPVKDSLELGVKGKVDHYHFTFNLDDGPPLSIPTGFNETNGYVPVDIMLRPPPFGGMFSGMAFGIYSFGKGGPCLEPATFSNVRTITGDC